MRRSTGVLILPSLLALALAPSAPAQDIPQSRQLEFIRGLARELGFLELAEAEVERIKGSGDGGADAADLAFTLAELRYLAIRSTGLKVTSADAAVRAAAYRERILAYDSAIDAWNDYLAKYQTRKSEAATTMLNAVQEKLDITGYWMDTDEDMEAEVRTFLVDRALETHNQVDRRWMAAIRHGDDIIMALEKKIDSLFEGLTGDDESDQPILDDIDRVYVQVYRLLFAKGEVYLAQARLLIIKEGNQTGGEAKSFLDAGERTFRKLARLAGDDSNTGLLATTRQGECYLRQGQVKKAQRYFTRVMTAAVPCDPIPGTRRPDLGKVDKLSLEGAKEDSGWNDVQMRAYLRERRVPMCLAFETAIRLFRERGFVPEALQFASGFQMVIDRWKASVEMPEVWIRELGNFEEAYRATLETGVTLSLAGRTAEAIQLVSGVVRSNTDDLTLRPTNFLGRKAIGAIAKIAQHAPSTMLSADDYIWAGISAYLDKDYEDCIRFLRRGMRRLVERGVADANLTQLESRIAQCYNHIGLCMHFLTEGGEKLRHLATMNARHTALYFIDEDERFAGADLPTCVASKRFNSWTRKLADESPADVKLTETWRAEANRLIGARCDEGHEGRELAYGIQKYKAKDYAGARRHFKAIDDKEHAKYFQAQVLLGMCDWEEELYQECLDVEQAALSYLELKKQKARNQGKVFRAANEPGYVEKAQYYAGRSLYELAARETDEGKKPALRLAAIRKLLDSVEKPLDMGQAATALYYTITLMGVENMVTQAKVQFARLEELAENRPKLIPKPAYIIYRMLIPSIPGLDAEASLDASYSREVYDKLKEAVVYLQKVNEKSSTPAFQNRLKVAKILTEIGKTGDKSYAESAREKWQVLLEDYPDENRKRKEDEKRTFEEELARVSMLIGTKTDFELAANTFLKKVFYTYTTDEEGKRTFEEGFNENEARGRKIEYGGKSRVEYFRSKVSRADLELGAMAHCGWLQPDFQKPGSEPLRTQGLSHWLQSENSSAAADRERLLFTHQAGKEMWGYLLSLQGNSIDERYLKYRLNYDFAKAYYAKEILENARERTAIYEALNTFRDRILHAGPEWGKLGAVVKDEAGNPLSKERAQAWSKAYLWLERYLRG